MTDSIDNKSKEKRDNLDVGLDAMLDEAESSLLSKIEFQDDEDAIDRLLMKSDFDADDAPGQSNMEGDSALKEFSDFSDVSDLNEPEMVRQDSPRTAVADEVDDFFGLGDDFIESKLIQDDEVEATAPTVADLIAANEEQQVVIEGSDVDEDVGAPEELDDFSGLSDDLNEADMIQGVEQSFGDEDAIDSLSPDAGFDSEDALEQMVGKKDEFSDDADLIETDDFFQLDEVSDDFSRQTEEVQLAETEILSTQDDQEDDFLLPDFDITADTESSDVGSDAGIKEDAFGNVDLLNEEEALDIFGLEAADSKSGGNEAVVEPELKQISATDTVINAKENIEDVKLSPFEFEQKDINKQLEDAESKVKKAKLLSYAAAGFGAVALSAAIGFGVMIFSAKTEVSKLTEAVSTLEASLARSAANSPNEEIDAMRNSVVQLNQQIDGFITELKGNPLFPVDLLNSKVPDIVAKQDMVSKSLDMLQVKMGGLEEKASSKPSDAESPKVEVTDESAPAQEDNAHEIAPTKEGAAHEHAPTVVRAMHEIAPAKKVEAAPETVPAKVKTQLKVVAVKPIVPPKAVFKQESVKVKIHAAPGKWGINLIAFKQEWFAKSKVAEFAQQGVVAEVIPVHERDVTMYRLRVGGFKSKAEADSNTARIKRALNLDSVWVSDN